MEAHADARRAFATLYQTQRRVAGPESPETLEALVGLAVELGKVGELEESRRRWEELTVVYRIALPSTATLRYPPRMARMSAMRSDFRFP